MGRLSLSGFKSTPLPDGGPNADKAEEVPMKVLLSIFALLLVAGFAVFGEGRTTRGARLRRKSMSMM